MWFALTVGVAVALPFSLWVYLMLVEAPTDWSARVRPRSHHVRVVDAPRLETVFRPSLFDDAKASTGFVLVHPRRTDEVRFGPFANWDDLVLWYETKGWRNGVRPSQVVSVDLWTTSTAGLVDPYGDETKWWYDQSPFA